jgi:protein-disulfide isomerase
MLKQIQINDLLKNLGLLVLGGSIGYFALSKSTSSFKAQESSSASEILEATLEPKVQNIIKSYILNNPEIIIQAAEKYQETKMQEIKNDSKSVIAQNINLIENDPLSPAIGSLDSKNIIVYYFDYTCGYCKKANEVLLSYLDNNKNTKVVFKMFPILGAASEIAAQASTAVYSIYKNKFLEFHNQLIYTDQLTTSTPREVAESMGLDWNKILNKMNSKEIQDNIKNGRNLGIKAKITGTPGFIINREFYPGVLTDTQIHEAFLKTSK